MSTANIVSIGLAGIVAGGIGVRNSFVLAGALIGCGAVVAFLLFLRSSRAASAGCEMPFAGTAR